MSIPNSQSIALSAFPLVPTSSFSKSVSMFLLCTAKETINKTKRTHRMGQNTCKWCNQQGISLQNCKQHMLLNIKKTNNLIKKWAEDLTRHFSKKRHTATNHMKRCSTVLTIRKMVKKCKSKLQWDVTSHQSEWPSSKSLQTINAGKGVEKRESSFTVSGNVNWYNCYGEQYRLSLKD